MSAVKKIATLFSLAVFMQLANASDVNISKKFTPDTRKELEKTTVELTLTNENVNFDALNAAVTDILPSGMTVATPLNAVVSNCGAGVSIVSAADSVIITGAQISKFTSTPTPCVVKFDVLSPKLGTGESQSNYINDIAVGGLTANINGMLVSNETSATATLTVKKNEVEISHGFYLNGVSTEMNTNRYFNDGEDLYLITTITNPSFVQLTGVNFTNSFANNVVNGATADVTTSCGGTVTLDKATPSSTQDQVTLIGASIPPNGSCEVRVKVNRTTSKFQYRNATTGDSVAIGSVTTDQGFSNTEGDYASVRAVGGPRIYKYFCDNVGRGCKQSLSVPTSSGTQERYVLLRLLNNNADSSPFRSVFTDRLPAGMTLAPSPDLRVTPTACSAVNVTGSAGSADIVVDARNMPVAPVTTSANQYRLSQCYVYAKVIFDATTDNAEYQNTLFAGKTPTGGAVNDPTNSYNWPVNGGHNDDIKGGFSPYFQSSELIVEKPEYFSVSKKFSEFYVRAGHQFSMTLTLTNNSANDITDVNIADDLKTMRFATKEPVIFNQGGDGTANASTTCPAGNVGTYITGQQQLNFSGLTVPANSSCTITVPLIVDSSIAIRPAGFVQMTNTIKGSDVSYTSGGVSSTLDEDVTDAIRLRVRYDRRKTFTPDEIKAGGSSRVNVRVLIYGGAVSDMSNLNVRDNLPSGMKLADDPEVSFTCDQTIPTGVTFDATPGSSVFGVVVGNIPKTALNVNNVCYLRATVKTDASYTASTMTNTANVTVEEGAGPLESKVIESYYSLLTDSIKVDSLAQLAVNKTVSIEDVGVGGAVRTLITMDNTLPNAINLTNVTLTDDLRLSGSSELLVVDPANATFGEDANGSQTTCTGGKFDINSSRTAITLSEANIPAGSICVFAFDMTAQKSGSWTNMIAAESVETFEGITNPGPTQKAASFSGSLAIGAKKLATSFVKNSDGSYTVNYKVGVKNFSVFPLQDVTMEDDLSREFGILGSDYRISVAPSMISSTTGASLTLNSAYDGSANQQLAFGGVLPVDGEVVVAFSVTFTPRKGDFSFDNQAKVSGKSAGGLETSDKSNDADYVSSTNDNPAENNDKTTIDIPQIGVTKSTTTVTNNNDGTFTADYSVKVKNYGNLGLTNVVLTDSLASEFAGTDYRISTTPALASGTGLTLTAGYNGGSQAELAKGALALNAEVVITFSVTFKPITNKVTYNNQATATATSVNDPRFTTSDLSNDLDYEDTSSSSKTNNGDPTDDNVPTPAIVNPKTLLGIAKAASASKAETDSTGSPTGNFTTDITIVVKNMGDEDLKDVRVTDSLINNVKTGTGFGTKAVTSSPVVSGEFMVSDVAISNGTGANFLPTTNYDGATQAEIATAKMLPRASQATLTFTITWRPESGKALYVNQTSGIAAGDVTGDAVRDDSDNGTIPDGDGNGDPTNDSRPTPTTITTTPRVGLAKAATALKPLGSNGAFSTRMTLTVKNYGNELLKDITINDALDNAATGFGVYVTDVASVIKAGQYTVTAELPAGSPLTLNPSYTGSGSNTQLISSGKLGIAETTAVTLIITFIPDLANNRYDYENVAIVVAKGDISSKVSTDNSVDGTNPDSNGDNNPDEQSATKVSVTPDPVIGIAKQETTVDNLNGTFTTSVALAIENLGNEALGGVKIVDNLNTEFGSYVVSTADLTAAGKYTITNVLATGLAAESTFTGSGATDVVAKGTLAIGAKANVTFDVVYNPAKTNYVNQAVASAIGAVSAKGANDSSDNGTAVDADGDGDPTEQDENDPTPISITPQPVIGSAKTAGAVVDNNDGTFSVPYTVLIENIGNENLMQLVVTDSLVAEFGAYDSKITTDGSYAITDISASGATKKLILNNSYTGAKGNDTLITSGELAVDESVTVAFTVTFRPANTKDTEFNNQVSVTAQGIATGTATTDLSNDGGVIDTDGNGIANETVGSGDTGDNKMTTININRSPKAVDDNYVTLVNTAVTLKPLMGDSDPEGGVLTIVSIANTDLTPGKAQTIAVPNGSVAIAVDGKITFTPKQDFMGKVTFPYVIKDQKGETTSANEVIIVSALPVAVDDNYSIVSDSSVVLSPLKGDSDPDGDTLAILSINGINLTPGKAQIIKVPNGKVAISKAGEMVFTPTAGFSGRIIFPYVISDGTDTATANEIINVNKAISSSPPVAVDDSYAMGSGSILTLTPLKGDSDPDGDTLSIVSINGVDLRPGKAQTITVSNGKVTISSTGEISFTPNVGFSGEVIFPYVISDGKQTAEANEKIFVSQRLGDGVSSPEHVPTTSLWSLFVLLSVIFSVSTLRLTRKAKKC